MKAKVLVISNNCFSKTDSNGRTLGNFFWGWPKDKLAQFYIQRKTPDFTYCSSFYSVSDGEALKSIFGKKTNGIVLQSEIKNEQQEKEYGENKKIKKTPFTMLMRNYVWKIGAWKKYGFWEWVRKFSPDVVVLQAGDSPFMYDLAYETAVKFQAKLIIYNSEGYYFKNYDYFQSKGAAHLFYPLFLYELRKSLRRAYRYSAHVFYSCEELEQEYQKIMQHNSETIYTGSEMRPRFENNTKDKTQLIFTYCGNLGLNRHQGLVEIANCLQDINPNLHVDVYGKIPNVQVEKDFAHCKGICYKGVISYEKVKEVMYQSDVLLHTESFDEFYKEDLKFAFSTKIADSLSCGRCFLLYAPKNLACTKYLMKEKAAYVVTDKEQLKSILTTLIYEPDERNRYIAKAVELSVQNHRKEKGCIQFQKVLQKNENV